MVGDNTLPGCIGYYGMPLAPNGPCEACKHKELCQRIAQNFVPKTEVERVSGEVREVLAILREG